MTVVKINAITVRAGSGDELARRFALRAGAVDDVDGFEGFELLRPTDDRQQWLVLTRWRDEASFAAWVGSPAFAAGHRGSGTGPADDSGAQPAPVGAHSELWSYDIVDLPSPR
jgi:heme-degrading monooxygenase HmoA